MTRRRRPQSGRFPRRVVGPCEITGGRHSKISSINRIISAITFGKYLEGPRLRRRPPNPPVSLAPWKILVWPLGCPKIDQKSIKILINFRSRFGIDLGSFWDSNLGSFSAFLAPKFGQVRSKTGLESLSTSKT